MSPKALDGLFLATFDENGGAAPEFKVAAQLGKQVNEAGDCGKIYTKCQRLSLNNTVA